MEITAVARQRPQGRPVTPRRILCLVFLILLADYALLVVRPALHQQTHGYAVYYTASRLLRDGRGSVLYDDPAFNRAIRAYGIPGIYDIYDANAPTTALVLLPLAGLPTASARPVWILVNLALLGVAAWLLAALLRAGSPPAPAVPTFLRAMPRIDAARLSIPPLPAVVGAALLLYYPVTVNLRLGQLYVLVLTLLIAAALALATGRPLLAGLAMAGLFAVKGYYGLLFVAVLLAGRQWRAALVALVASLVLVLASLPVVGPADWRAYLRSSNELAASPTTTVTAYQTIHGLLGHLFWRDRHWNPHPWLSAPAFAHALWLVGAAGLIGLALWLTWRRGWAVGLTAMIPISLLVAPMAEEYHYTLLVLPLALLWRWAILIQPSPLWRGALCLATLLAMAPFPTYGHGSGASGGNLLYYSKLAAGVLALAVACKASGHGSDRAVR